MRKLLRKTIRFYKQKKRTIIKVSFVSVFVLGGFVATGWKENQPVRPEIKLGVYPWSGYSLLYLADSLGYFRQEGLSLSLVEMPTSVDLRHEFEQGHINMFASPLSDVLSVGRYTSQEANVFLVTSYSNGHDVILTPPPYQSVSNLKHKRVGVEAGSSGMQLLVHALESEKMSMEDVLVVPMDQALMREALAQGLIDAAVSYPPYSVTLMKEQGVMKLFDSSQAPASVMDVISIEKTLGDKHPEVVEGFTRAWNRAYNYMLSNQDRAYSIIAKRLNTTPKHYIASLEGVKILHSTEQQKLFAVGAVEHNLTLASKLLRYQPKNENGQPQEYLYAHSAESDE